MRASFSIWWRALRAYSFSATGIPVVCGFLFAAASGAAVEPALFPLCLFSALLLHAGTNLLNDYYDYILGFDRPGEASGSSGLLTEQVVSPGDLYNRGRFYLIAGAAAGIPLILVRGWPLLLIGILGTAGAGLYSHRAGYKYKGLGELFVFFLMGPLLFFAAVYTACGAWPDGALWAAVSCGCMVTAILLVNNLRDIQMDRRAGFVTLPMRIGIKPAKHLYGLLVGIAFAVPVVLWRAVEMNAALLLPVLALPIAFRTVCRVQCADRLAVDLTSLPQQTAMLYLLYGTLLAVGLFFNG